MVIANAYFCIKQAALTQKSTEKVLYKHVNSIDKSNIKMQNAKMMRGATTWGRPYVCLASRDSDSGRGGKSGVEIVEIRGKFWYHVAWLVKERAIAVYRGNPGSDYQIINE